MEITFLFIPSNFWLLPRFLDGPSLLILLLCVRQFYGIERLRGGGGEEDLTYLVLEDLTQAGLEKPGFFF
jgi:hypothetical protein